MQNYILELTILGIEIQQMNAKKQGHKVLCKSSGNHDIHICQDYKKIGR